MLAVIPPLPYINLQCQALVLDCTTPQHGGARHGCMRDIPLAENPPQSVVPEEHTALLSSQSVFKGLFIVRISQWKPAQAPQARLCEVRLGYGAGRRAAQECMRSLHAMVHLHTASV